MATYKAEFLSHYYEGRLRPRHAYCDGPDLLVGAAGGVACPSWSTSSARRRACATWPSGSAASRRSGACRPSPRRRSRSGFAGAAPRNQGKPPVILWPDTFNNHFHPEIGKAAVEVLEAAGFQVLVPAASLCCGRPLYDFGMLDTAKALLRQILDDAAAADRGRRPGRRPGAELRRGLPRRADQPLPARRGRQAAAASRRSCSASS